MTQTNQKFDTPITNFQDLISYFFNNSQKSSKIGIEFESFLYHKNNYQPITQQDISNLLNLYPSQDFTSIHENNTIIGLSYKDGNISTEPAGQIEFSSIPYTNINEIAIASLNYYKILFPKLEKLNLGLVNFGYNPIHSLSELKILPKKRYHIMEKYMESINTLGVSMMKATATVQANLDYTSEEDLSKKFRVSMALSPLIGVLYSNSPFSNQSINNYQSYRNYIWQHTDNQRSGSLDFALSENFDIKDYINHILDIPMYFILKNNQYYNSNNHTFKEYLNHDFKHNFTPTIEDFAIHISTIYHDVRLKTYLEMRTADCPTFHLLPSLPAIYTGLLYNQTSLENCLSLAKKITFKHLQEFKINSIKQGLNTSFLNKNILFYLNEILEIAYFGLKSRGFNEEIHLDPLLSLIKNNNTQSDILIKDYLNNQSDIYKIVQKYSLHNNLNIFNE